MAKHRIRHDLLKYNEIVVIQQPHVVRGSYGSETTTWVELAQVWAQVSIIGADDEDFVEGSDRVVVGTQARITIRWRGDVSEIMRVVVSGRAPGLSRWEIEGVGEVGRRRETELKCRIAP